MNTVSWRGGMAGAALMLGGCAASRVPPPSPDLPAVAAGRTAVVLAVRAQSPGLSRDDVLRALGGGAVQAGAEGGGADVTLRLADGRMVSVVQPVSVRLKVGSRVVLRDAVANGRPVVAELADRGG